MLTDLSEPVAWQAIQSRNPSFDHRFVFAVVTTGIFCKPSCPARRPLRKNVQFFPTPQHALNAGFRPCKRCTPHSPLTPIEQAVRSALQLLHENPSQSLSLDSLARRANLSKFHFLREFKKATGLTPGAYQRSCQLQILKASLRSRTSLASALLQPGARTNQKSLGMTPATYKFSGNNTQITYTTAPCSMGRVLIATTSRGLCAVFLADTDSHLEFQLRKEFPAATITKNEKDLRSILRTVLHTIDHQHPFPPSIPLDLRGTLLQMRVWHALKTIPPGKTRTYSQLAKQIHAPRAIRAVASACAKNRIAILIPCHRALRADHKPSGYRWGLDRKSTLLKRETDSHTKPERR